MFGRLSSGWGACLIVRLCEGVNIFRVAMVMAVSCGNFHFQDYM